MRRTAMIKIEGCQRSRTSTKIRPFRHILKEGRGWPTNHRVNFIPNTSHQELCPWSHHIVEYGIGNVVCCIALAWVHHVTSSNSTSQRRQLCTVRVLIRRVAHLW
mmetsp:Transcript_19957/g.55513  ORF Transcript_19957/g.55513 Transcript_19957/m.55513 type:complete len:105 (+) Transcript_19957:2457-2771(+)